MNTPVKRRIRGSACKVEGCSTRIHRDGYCKPHLTRFESGRPLDDLIWGRHKNLTCRHEGCQRPVGSADSGGFGYCGPHLRRLRSGKPMDAPIRLNRDPLRRCSIDGCADPHLAKGYCRRHYVTETGKGAEYVLAYRTRKRGGVPYTKDELSSKFEYWGNRCWICGQAQGLEADHVKPISKGGIDALCNLRPACRQCNASKGAAWPLGERFSGGANVGLPVADDDRMGDRMPRRDAPVRGGR
jgi:5-methylcytosine-specific restriction endonuclease McrA